MQAQQQIDIPNQIQAIKLFQNVQKECILLQQLEKTSRTPQQLVHELENILKAIRNFNLFSPNQKIKQIHTQNLKLLALPYRIGFLYSQIRQSRLLAVQNAKNYFTVFLQIMRSFSCEQEEVFPKIAQKSWDQQIKNSKYRPSRQQAIQAHKDKKIIEERYAKSAQIKQQSDRRKSILDFLTLKIFDAVAQLRHLAQQTQILVYKASLQDPKMKQAHEAALQQPIPKIKVWKVPAKQTISECMCPSQKRKDLVAQVWQQNANKPTMTLEEVGQLQYQNMIQRQQRQKKLRQQNKQDSDSDKEQVDNRKKTQARKWDDWKDEHEKGAGNRNGR